MGKNRWVFPGMSLSFFLEMSISPPKNQQGPSEKEVQKDLFFAGFFWISSPHQFWDPMILRAHEN